MMFVGWLRSWWRSPGRLQAVQFVMYTRQGCHLCAEAWRVLQEEQRRHGFALQAVDVDAEPELVARYGECVPVVTVDGQVRFRGGLNRVLLARLLRRQRRG
jgi:glutaredoxin